MKSLSLQEILNQTGGKIIQGSGNPTINDVIDYSKKSIDNQTLVFHMDREQLKGSYWKNNKGIAVITDRPELCTNFGKNIIVIKTENLEAAYWNFIEFYRGLFDIPIIGLTGTCGKTSTKEIIKQILKQDYNVKSTWMSMNSMSVNLRNLTKIDEETEVAVYEMPVAYPGYLSTACRCFKPQIRILLNIGVHHLTGCETPEVYMKAKGEIVDGLDPIHGVLILNDDDENIKKVIDTQPFTNIVYFGKSERSHYRLVKFMYGNGGMNFTFTKSGKYYEAFVPGYGEHNIYNALAALAAVSFVGIDVPTAIKRLASIEQVEEHLEFKDGVNGCTVIDDTWNSAPLSMSTALKVLHDVTQFQNKKSIALLGYIPQLGKGAYADEQYSEMGKKAVEANVDLLIVVGTMAKGIGESALIHGFPADKVYFCETGDEVYQIIKSHLEKETIILLKITHRVMEQTSFKELKRKLITGPDREQAN